MNSIKTVKHIVLFVALFFSLTACSLLDLCANRLLQRVPAPKDPWEAIIFERDCGATTGFSKHVSVISLGAKLGNETGNVFVADGDHKISGLPVYVRWISNREIEVTYPEGLRIFKSEVQVRHVRVTYRVLER